MLVYIFVFWLVNVVVWKWCLTLHAKTHLKTLPPYQYFNWIWFQACISKIPRERWVSDYNIIYGHLSSHPHCSWIVSNTGPQFSVCKTYSVNTWILESHHITEVSNSLFSLLLLPCYQLFCFERNVTFMSFSSLLSPLQILNLILK